MEEAKNPLPNPGERRPIDPSLDTAEYKLLQAGVFKGHEGLRGLVNAQDFWDEQPYGTRLYFGGGPADYLHRDVLRAAIMLLDGPGTFCSTKDRK